MRSHSDAALIGVEEHHTLSNQIERIWVTPPLIYLGRAMPLPKSCDWLLELSRVHAFSVAIMTCS